MVWSKLSPPGYTWHSFLRLRDTSVGDMMRQMLINGDYVELWCASPSTDVTCVHRSQRSRRHRFSSCRYGRIWLMFPWFAVLYWYVAIQRCIILSTESMVRWTKNGQIKCATFDTTTTWKIQNCILSLGCFLRRLVHSAGLKVLLISILSVPGCW